MRGVRAGVGSLIGILAWLGLTGGLLGAGPAVAEEPPFLAERVTGGELPPLRERLPDRPLVVKTDPEAMYGGELRTLIGTPKDLKLLFVYGYKRLVRFDPSDQVVPDIAEAVAVKEGRAFKLHLR